MIKSLLGTRYKKKNVNNEMMILGFNIHISKMYANQISLSNFWKVVFSMYQFSSIQISKESLKVYIGKISHPHFSKSLINEEIQTFKTLGVKFLPQTVELIPFTVDINDNMRETGLKQSSFSEIIGLKHQRYYSFIELSLKSSFKQSLKGLMEINGLKFVIFHETVGNYDYYNVSIFIFSDSEKEMISSEEKLKNYLKLNPILQGKIMLKSSDSVNREPGRTLLGSNKFRMSKKIIDDLLKPIEVIIRERGFKVPFQPKKVFPWLGFQNNLENSKPMSISANIKTPKEGIKEFDNIKTESINSEQNNLEMMKIIKELNFSQNYTIRKSKIFFRIQKMAVTIHVFQNASEVHLNEFSRNTILSSNNLNFILILDKGKMEENKFPDIDLISN